MESKIGLSQGDIAKARDIAKSIVKPVQDYVTIHSTTTVERTTLRLAGADNVNDQGVPVANLVVDSLGDKLSGGALKYYVNALLRDGLSVQELNQKIATGYDISNIPLVDFEDILEKSKELVQNFSKIVKDHVKYRSEKLELYKDKINHPNLYVIVATGNIYEDVKQAKAAAQEGADIIAVIRTTAQSLLDYVPYGATTEGFGGTYATQENFKIMRKALDEVGKKVGKYIKLVNYASGMCMPEIAAMGALERLDMMLNDSMYGILFRDINMYRTFVDQNFSRMINSFAQIIINTGEDNYLTTSDAYEKGYTVIASQLINEQFAFLSGMPSKLQGLGHAFEMDPELENGFLYELAQAQLSREIFPEAPLKYMPPTKHMTGDIFKGYRMNSMYNIIAKLTNQDINLLGMLTEAIHTPFMQDRFLAIENAKYVNSSIKNLSDEIYYKKDGIVVTRAKKVLAKSIEFLESINKKGLLKSISDGDFAEIKRAENGGKGLEGVFEKDRDYFNPFETFLKKELHIKNEVKL